MLLIYLATGFYVVKPDELAVVRRFGRVTLAEGILPGIHYRFPYPIAQVDTPQTACVKQVRIGKGPKLRSGKSTEADKMAEVLVGDTNILNVQMNVQYLIGNPYKYLFNTRDPEQLIALTAESVLVEILGTMGVDHVLTVGKIEIQEKVKTKTQGLLDRYGVGAKVIGVNLQSVEPPVQVIQAFNDVSSAKIDRQRLINEALGRKDELLPRARGEAHRLREAAKGYALDMVNTALGESHRFSSILTEFRKSKDVTRTRIYIEAMERILPQLKKYIVDTGSDTPVGLGFLEEK